MPQLNVTPQVLAAAANDLSAIASTMNGANAAAAAPTTDLTAAGADPVSAYLAALFNYHAHNYQAIGAQAATFHEEFIQLMRTGAGQYALTEESNASPMQDAIGAVKAAAKSPSGRALIDGAKSTVGAGHEAAERVFVDGNTGGAAAAAPVGSTSYAGGGGNGGGYGANGGAGNAGASGVSHGGSVGGGDYGGGATSGAAGPSAGSASSGGVPSGAGGSIITAGGGGAGWVVDPGLGGFGAASPGAAASVGGGVVPATPLGGGIEGGGLGPVNPGLFAGASGAVGHGVGPSGDAGAGSTFVAGGNGEYGAIAGMGAPAAPVAPVASPAATAPSAGSPAAEQALPARAQPLQVGDAAQPTLARADTSAQAAHHAAPLEGDKSLLIVPLPSLRKLRDKLKQLTDPKTSERWGESEFYKPGRENAFSQLSKRDQLLQALGIRPPDTVDQDALTS